MLQTDWPTLSLSSGGIFSISTFALSLLLVFRTNSSYEVSKTPPQQQQEQQAGGQAIRACLVNCMLLASKCYTCPPPN